MSSAAVDPIWSARRRSARPDLLPLTVAHLLDEPERGYLLKGIIAPAELSVWWGAPKCGKSFLMLHIAYALAQGRRVFGRRVRPARVLYVACEGRSGLRARMEALGAEHGPAPNLLLLAQAIDLWAEVGDGDALIALMQREQIELLVIDTLNRVMSAGDENSSADMGAVIGTLDRIRAETGAHVALVHHGTKAGTGGPRGHGSLAGAADAVIEVSAAEDGSHSAVLRDVKDDAGGAFGFRLRVVELGWDADGDARTTCVVDEAEPQVRPEKAKPLPAAQRAALELLERAIIDEGVPAAGSANIPAGVLTVPIETWRAYAYRGGIAASESQDARQKAFRRAVTELQGRGRVGCWDGLVWLAQPDTGHDRTLSALSGSVRPGTDRTDIRTDTDTPL